MHHLRGRLQLGIPKLQRGGGAVLHHPARVHDRDVTILARQLHRPNQAVKARLRHDVSIHYGSVEVHDTRRLRIAPRWADGGTLTRADRDEAVVANKPQGARVAARARDRNAVSVAHRPVGHLNAAVVVSAGYRQVSRFAKERQALDQAGLPVGPINRRSGGIQRDVERFRQGLRTDQHRAVGAVKVCPQDAANTAFVKVHDIIVGDVDLFVLRVNG
mmetsp:Transcript_1155/g.2855  ORF Transcript_1155/g.2855 Transcript_1155/m.2855 type:complete len:217 (-) Transcript_1155:700-1350(-)